MAENTPETQIKRGRERIPPKRLTRRTLIGAFRDRLKAANALSEIDPLTGIPNLRAYEKRRSEEIERMKRTGRKATVMLLDLDNFKQINDTQGHDSGDEQLKITALTLRRGVRATDFVARAGEKGDEFRIIFPETDAKQVRLIWGGKIKTHYPRNGNCTKRRSCRIRS